MNPFVRLKVNGDVFFLPDADGNVYFRNNIGSFRIEGRGIDQWIEKLLPALDGSTTLGELTSGLPAEYKERILDIAGALYRNGFVRDISQDRPHRLPEPIVSKYAPQIEFLDSFGGSGASRFQAYRETKVLAIGSGSFLVSLVSALLESGLPKLHLLITDAETTNLQRIEELASHARKSDPEAEIKDVSVRSEGSASWREALQPYDVVMFVAEQCDARGLRLIEACCREADKMFIPAIGIERIGMAGPFVRPDSEACWESAWRRLHRLPLNRDPQLYAFSSTAGSLLANLIVFEAFKAVTGVTDRASQAECFLLNLETLEGEWHSFLPHPLIDEPVSAEPLPDAGTLIEEQDGRADPNELLTYFNGLTSPATGIFHVWEEGELRQLPLAQCRVQAADPLSDGPAELLPEFVCGKLTHEEARREAGLAGMEAYSSRIARTLSLDANVSAGVGATAAESIGRGLRNALTVELRRRLAERKPYVTKTHLGVVEDERCRFYLRALTTLQGVPAIGRSEDVYGFPVLWVRTNSGWCGSIGLSSTLALRNVLEQALLEAQNPGIRFDGPRLAFPSFISIEKEAEPLFIPASAEGMDKETVRSALAVLERHPVRLQLCNLAVEPFMKHKIISVIGVSLRKEGSL